MVDSAIVEAWKKAPRVNLFASFFETTASGLGGMPDLGKPVPDFDLLSHDLDCMTFWGTQQTLWGHFDAHYFASIPYRLEEECRLGSAIFSFAQKAWTRNGRIATIYTLGAGAGTLARTLAALGDGLVKSINCSPTNGNRVSFFANQGSPHASFYLGPFFELDDLRYETDKTLQPFRDGYDVLLEDTTFQMYGRDRENQTGFIAPRIRENGVLIQVQKLRHPDAGTYLKREIQKDGAFKAKYFSANQIIEKKREVLDTMVDFQVDLETSRSALRSYFRYSVVTWNSGNFYTIVSSNSHQAICDLITTMIKPAIAPEFCYELLPYVLLDDEHSPLPSDWTWRAPKSAAVKAGP
ncbi:class I SAM-dependent methyltransferase (plasmid) [Agrobacterium sp. rho-13.3]|uniref:class I SAM-dependent methyltransferase n=1 Tax=Agrobacterium sp. rho-13.3 TaxID=3072980 RepID=UPI002A180D42|nr:class I SAM-dependent methyltransferase [Agrobacterium sp. rho-13.3]MDX8310129.1 class I SAM-dependent methyltransferase [Agrobacterium sp. rho-13.3]